VSHLSSIDGLKGLAILSTIHSHISLEGFTPPGHLHFNLIQPQALCTSDANVAVGVFVSPFSLLTSSRRGVSILFAINGFLLSLPYVAGKRPLPSAFTFWRRRLGRLVPLFHLRVLLSLVIRPLQHDFFSLEFLKQLALLLTLTFPLTEEAFAPHLIASNGHVSLSFIWTLGVTITFIMWFPLLIAAFLRAPKLFFLGSLMLSIGTRALALGGPPLTQLASFYHIPTTQLIRDGLCGR
jgi:peptidoglycan/LPS O-acetylase OafA/YrhL